MKDILGYCRPEDVGVHPSWVEDYVNEINRRRKVQHSFVMARGTRVFAEGYWKPFHRDLLHRMYSVSKSFVSAAIGMLADEGRISLDDTILTYFPEQDDGTIHPLTRAMTIRDMLMMATCNRGQSYGVGDENWLHTFFHPHSEPDHPAGTEFRYDTASSYTLDVLVERLTGKTFLEYLKDKALRELGFSEDAWCVEAPEGYAWGGSGVECTTRDLVRFALLFANGGVVGGKRYLSEDYVRAATAKQICNLNDSGGKVDSCSGHGYGYQIWRTRDNGFAFLGMGGQLGVIIPDRDFIFACNSDTQGDTDGYHGFVDMLFDTVIDRIGSDSIPHDDDAFARLQTVLGALEINVPAGAVYQPQQEDIDGVTYTLSENRMGMTDVTFEFHGSTGLLTCQTTRGVRRFPFCMGRYADTTFPETHYFGKRIRQPKGEEYRCLNCAVWEDEHTLLVRTYIIDDYFGNMAARFVFDKDAVSLQITKTAEWFLEEYAGDADGHRA